MRGANSAPTERVLDIVELLSRTGNREMRFSDVVRELDLSQGTAHAILKTLSDRGWVTRDPVAKTFALGPTLTLVASRLDTARPMAHLARDAARRLAETTAMPASVIERIGDELLITAFERPADASVTPLPNERIPYAPPFGVGFAAWDTPSERQAWVRRGASGDSALSERLATVLDRTRERGYDVDWMTPTLAQAAHAIGTLSGDTLPQNLRSIIDRLRVEFTSAGLIPDDTTRGAHPVATISAPVLDDDGRIQLVLAVHPVQPMTTREVRIAAKPLLREIARLSHRSIATAVRTDTR